MSDQVQSLLAEVATHYPEGELGPLRAACAWHAESDDSAERREEQRQALGAAMALAGMRLDPAALAATLVAPRVVRGAVDVATVSERLGEPVARLVEGVARLASIRWDRIEEEAAESLRKLFLAMARDVRVVVVVLALRVQRMRTLRDGVLDPVETVRYAHETLEVFAPLASRLGIWQLKWELEDWALRVIEPEAFAELTAALDAKREERDAFVAEVTAMLRKALAAEGITAKVSGRAKHMYSIYKKMQHKQVSFDHIFDVQALRVVTEKLADCYAVLGLVHTTWVPLPSEFEDYIARPKENGYQSLHTAVLGPGGKPFEVQIRTQEMHRYAEIGVAAHWAYKERRKPDQKADAKFHVLRQLMGWERDMGDPHQFVESLKTDVFGDQVYVFTPTGDIVDLPLGATPLDFAYRIHTLVGHRCRGARVNDQIQPLDYVLKTGDRVEVLTAKTPSPSRDWMNPSFGYLKTASARGKVRAWFRQQARATAEQQGKELVDKELGRLDLQCVTVADVATALKYDTVEDLYAAVGYGDRHPQGIGSTAISLERELAPPEAPELPASVPEPPRRRAATGLSFDGVDDVLGKRARCCNPVPGDPVVGFVSRGRGIVIHRRDCAHVLSTDEPERLVEIEWGPRAGERHRVDVEIRARDRPGLLRDLSHVVSAAGVNMTAARAEGHRDGTAWLKLSLDCHSAEQVVKVLQNIDRMRDVLEVRRLAR